MGFMISAIASNRPTPAAVRRQPLKAAASVATSEADSVRLSGASSSAAPSARTGLSSATQVAAQATPGAAGAVLKVLTINTMFDCQEGVDKMVNLIQASGADLVGLQESVRNTRVLAKKLGMHFMQQDKRTALLSRFPIESVTPNRYAVKVTLDNGQKIAFANAHLTSFPFQSHQVCHLPSGGGPYIDTEEEAIASADKTRGDEVRMMIKEATSLNLPIVATGDFNEPSFLDWTEAAAASGRNPMKVDWPASRQYAEAGFRDSYRQLFPDEMAHPGYTWTPTTAPDDPSDHHDRIDFIMVRGDELQPKAVQIVGENSENADVVVDPYPSDHRGVVATFEVGGPVRA